MNKKERVICRFKWILRNLSVGLSVGLGSETGSGFEEPGGTSSTKNSQEYPWGSQGVQNGLPILSFYL